MEPGVDFIGVGVGGLCFNREGKVLLYKRGPNARGEKGKWDFPGGGVERGETLEQAYKREIKEEFGIEVEIVELLGVSQTMADGQHWVSPSFITRVVKGEAEIQPAEKIKGKIIEFEWVRVARVVDYPITQATRQNLDLYLKKNL